MNQVKRQINELHQKSKPVHEIKIQIFADNRIEVMGFPSSYHDAMNIMTAGLRRVANYFISMANEGKLDEKLSIKQNAIIQAKPNIIIPKGKMN